MMVLRVICKKKAGSYKGWAHLALGFSACDLFPFPLLHCAVTKSGGPFQFASIKLSDLKNKK